MDVTYTDMSGGSITWEKVPPDNYYNYFSPPAKSGSVIESRTVSITLPRPGVRGWEKTALHEYGHCMLPKTIDEYKVGCDMNLFYSDDDRYSMAKQTAEILAWVTCIRWVREDLVDDFIKQAVIDLDTYWVKITTEILKALMSQAPGDERIALTPIHKGSKKVEVSTW